MYRTFLKSLCATFLTVGLLSGSAQAATTLNLEFLSNEGTAEHASALYLKQYVENRTGGELLIDIYPGQQLCGNPNECFQALLSETVHIYPATAGGSAIVYPAFSALDLPYMMANEAIAQEVLGGQFEDKLRELFYKNTGGKFLMLGLSQSAGWRNYANTKRPIKSPADISGLKLRTVENEVQMQQVRMHGGSPTPIPFMEVYDALSKGVVDGTLNSVTDLTAVKLHEKAKFMTLDGHNFMFSAWYMSGDFFKKLPQNQQAALIDGFRLMGIVENGVQMDKERPAYDLFTEAGGKLYFPSAEEKAKLIEAVKPLRAWYLEKYGEQGKEFLDALDVSITAAESKVKSRYDSFNIVK